MGRKRTPGLTKRGEIWHIDKEVRGWGRLCESTGLSSLEEAELYLADRLREIRLIRSGQRLPIKWREAATKFLTENMHKASIDKDAQHLELLDEHIGSLLIDRVHDDSLRPFIDQRRRDGVRTKTINNALTVVRRILNLAARSWRLENGLTWLETAPLISMQKPPTGRSDSLKAYPLDWNEQETLLIHLAPHLAKMALFKVNTGCRESEVTGLRWEWECHTDIPELSGRIFIIPGDAVLPNDAGVKNRDDRLVVLNDIAKSVVDSCRGEHPDYVFIHRGKHILRMNNSSWQRAWQKAGLPCDGTYRKGVHNLRHTCGRRLRAAGVSKETRSVILGHRNGDITTHYSAPEIQEILTALNKLCQDKSRKTPALTVFKLRTARQAA